MLRRLVILAVVLAAMLFITLLLDFDGVVLKDNNGSGSNSITLSGTATDIQVMANPCQ